jgi:hypothetical protein
VKVHADKGQDGQVFSSKFINMNPLNKDKGSRNKKKKKSHIFYETENSFLARIWPEQGHLLKKESIYETMAKHNRNHKKGNLKTSGNLQEVTGDHKSKDSIRVTCRSQKEYSSGYFIRNAEDVHAIQPVQEVLGEVPSLHCQSQP